MSTRVTRAEYHLLTYVPDIMWRWGGPWCDLCDGLERATAFMKTPDNREIALCDEHKRVVEAIR